MASKNYTAPKYLNDFSKALAGEVRILLEEVGKLRDERQALQYEIAELMSLKSKHGAGGSYDPEWHPKALSPPPPEEAPPPPPAAPSPAPPAWRTVHKRAERRERAIKLQQNHAPPPAPAALPAPQRPEMPSWAQWRPNPLLAPTPMVPQPRQMVSSPPPRSGLFGPPTPPPK